MCCQYAFVPPGPFRLIYGSRHFRMVSINGPGIAMLALCMQYVALHMGAVHCGVMCHGPRTSPVTSRTRLMLSQVPASFEPRHAASCLHTGAVVPLIMYSAGDASTPRCTLPSCACVAGTWCGCSGALGPHKTTLAPVHRHHYHVQLVPQGCPGLLCPCLSWDIGLAHPEQACM